MFDLGLYKLSILIKMIKILSVEIKSLNLGTLHRNTRTANIFINDLKCFQKKKIYFLFSNLEYDFTIESLFREAFKKNIYI